MKKKLLTIIFFYHSFFSLAFADEIEEVKFISHGATLAGSIVFPPKDTAIISALVFVHGSGKQSRNMDIAKRFASEGIAALVYDKRGAGKSGGDYESEQSVSEKNISLLADDSIAALMTLRKHTKLQEVPVGLSGISQAGWIVPLAAQRSGKADFMALWSSPVCKVSQEDIFSKYTADLDVDRVPSYQEALNSRTQKYVWPDFLGKDSDPNESLQELGIPGLWIFGTQDGSIPVDLSIERLQTHIYAQREYDYVLFSGLGHNNMTETFPTVIEWIKRITYKN